MKVVHSILLTYLCNGCVLQDFIYQVGQPPVANVKTNGLYYEPGVKSYMREAISYQVFG